MTLPKQGNQHTQLHHKLQLKTAYSWISTLVEVQHYFLSWEKKEKRNIFEYVWKPIKTKQGWFLKTVSPLILVCHALFCSLWHFYFYPRQWVVSIFMTTAVIFCWYLLHPCQKIPLPIFSTRSNNKVFSDFGHSKEATLCCNQGCWNSFHTWGSHKLTLLMAVTF